MRVTDAMIYGNAARDGGAAKSRLEAATGPASTGVRVVHPGDDPAAAGLANQTASVLARARTIGTGAQRAADELGVIDTAFNDVTNALARVTELATQFGSAGYTAAQRATAADEVETLKKQIVSALNASVEGRYVMGGTLDGQPPFDAAGNYLGDANVRAGRGGAGGLAGRQRARRRGHQGGRRRARRRGAPRRMQADLRANNQAGVAGALTNLSTATDQVATARAAVGQSMNAFDAAVQTSQALATDAETRGAHLVQADAIEANTRLAQAQLALQASLTATTQGFKLTLLNYLSS